MLNKLVMASVAVGIILSITLVPIITEQLVDAKPTKKVHFTQTVTSFPDPGVGHGGNQLAMILHPNEGSLYDGSMTYAASKPVQIAVLHEIGLDDDKGQPTWTVSGDKLYGLSLIDAAASGSLEFTGAALALRSSESEKFVATVSVDGWIRGQPTEIIMQTIQRPPEIPELRLAHTVVPVVLPLHDGFYDGQSVQYVITDASDAEFIETILDRKGFNATLSEPLAQVPAESLNPIYIFEDGISGNGTLGYQPDVFASIPGQDNYGALRDIIQVSWRGGQTAEILESVEQINNASRMGRIKMDHTEMVLNAPQISWPGGAMTIRDDSAAPGYEGGQIMDLDTENMTVTFAAHRGWGPDGKTVYHIIVESTPAGPAGLMGVPDSPATAALGLEDVSAGMFHFSNGINGTGLVGFQPGIVSQDVTNVNYTPIWHVHLIEWHYPEEAMVLQTLHDIETFKDDDAVTAAPARPLNRDQIINAPIVEPFNKTTNG